MTAHALKIPSPEPLAISPTHRNVPVPQRFGKSSCGPHAPWHPPCSSPHSKGGENPMRSQKGFTLIELLIVVAIIGIIAAIAIPNPLSAIDRGKQKRTMADIRSLRTAVESYAVDNNFYPKVSTYAAVTPFLQPIYIKTATTESGSDKAWEV